MKPEILFSINVVNQPVLNTVNRSSNSVTYKTLTLKGKDHQSYNLSESLDIHPNLFPVGFTMKARNTATGRILNSLENLNDQINDSFLNDRIQFKLWERSYYDVIYPGENWRIDLESGVVSKRINTLDEDCYTASINIYNLDSLNMENIETLINENLDKYIKKKLKDGTKTHTLRINFNAIMIPENLITYYKYVVFPIWYATFCKIVRSKRNLIDNVYVNRRIKSEYGRSGSPTYEYLFLSDFKNGKVIEFKKVFKKVKPNYLLYCKTNPSCIFFLETEFECRLLLGILKFSTCKMPLPCGISLWEDYYYMPVFHNKMVLEPDGTVTLFELDSELKEYNEMVRDKLSTAKETVEPDKDIIEI